MKYKKERYYDIIAYPQTNFQKIIIDYLIKTKFSNKKILIIDVRNKKLIINNYKGYFFLNSVKTIKKSKESINYLKKQNLSCDILLGSHITGIPPLLLSKIIKYKKLYLIDDGMASFFISDLISSKNIYEKLRQIIIYIQILFFNNIKIENRRSLFNKINKYYHIYNLNYEFKFPLEKINPLKTNNINIKKYTAFIGQPLIDYNMIDKVDFISNLKKLVKKEDEIIYYCHPSEYWYKSVKINGVRFIKNKISIEELFNKEGFPEKIIGISSTFLLNSKYINKDINVFFIKTKTQNDSVKKIMNILKNNGVKEYLL